MCRQLGFSDEGKIIIARIEGELFYAGAYVLDHEERFGTSERDVVIGKLFCVGTEPELLECSHTGIGYYDYCSRLSIIISCYGKYKNTFLC